MFKSKIRPPEKFVGLHAHSGFSNFDGLGYPEDHIKFITSESQGMDAWALTDHGNGNGLAHAHSAAKKIQKSGKKYRQLYGVEFYFVPSLTQWKLDYEAHKQSVKDAKTAAEAAKKAKMKTDEDADVEEDDVDKGHVIEDESETKADDYKEKPTWQKRYHLVAVAQNHEGLKNINRLVRLSFKDGFYRYPRIDFDLIKKYGKGIVWSTACLGGYGSGIILQGQAYGKSSEEILRELSNMTDRFVDAVGEENFFLEIQFNKLNKQHIVNRFLIEHAKNTGLKLVATCDSHYPTPEKWQARELYKKLGWMGQKLDQEALPKFEDLKCELYPKNASQMWDEYQKSYADWPDLYEGTEEVVRDAIERSHDIAWKMCEDTWVDTKAKLPHLDKEGDPAFNQLARLVKDALITEGLSDKQEYIDRVKKELGDIKFLGHAPYFLTMYKIFHKAEQKTLFGPGRGSGPGSLVNYLLGITQIDPLKYDLLWERFLGRHRVSWPDIDCLFQQHLVKTYTGYKFLKDIAVGDIVIDHNQKQQHIVAVNKRKSTLDDNVVDIFVEDEITNTVGVIVATGKHRLIDANIKEVFVKDLRENNKLLMNNGKTCRVLKIAAHKEQIDLVDITVTESSVFQVVPFDVYESNGNFRTSYDYC